MTTETSFKRGEFESEDLIEADKTSLRLSQPKKGLRRRTVCVLVCVATLLTFVSVVTTVAVFVQCRSLKEQSSRSSSFCVACSDLYPEGYVDKSVDKIVASLDKYEDEEVEICCARNLSQRSEMLRLQLKRRDSLTYPYIFNSTKIDTRNLNFGGISAHKTLTTQFALDGTSEPKFGEKFYMLRIRKYNDARYEHVTGIDVTPSGLKVKVPGLYFVYKSIFFVPDTSHPCKNFKEQTFTSLLLRNSTLRVPHTDILLRSEHTCCPDCIQNRETTFTGGIFYLNEGDLIEVEISAYGLVYFKPDVTYMGIIFVSMAVPNSNQ